MPSQETNAPPIVYKYLSCDGAFPALRKLSVKYTPIEEFNDPFEGLLRNFSQQEFEELVSRARESVQKEQTWRKFCDCLPFKDLEKLYCCRRDVLAGRLDLDSCLKSALDITTKGMMERYPQSFSEHYGMVCFSARFDSILMWSHYAENHKGVVIGYHSRFFRPLYPVQYRKERVPLPVGQFTKRKGDPPLSMWHVKALTTKFIDWAYEQEWRGVERREKLLKTKVKDSVVLYSKVPPQTVASIYIGTRTDETLRNECISFARRHPNCRLFQARYDDRDFALAFDPVKV